jgi:hypothetical protein
MPDTGWLFADSGVEVAWVGGDVSWTNPFGALGEDIVKAEVLVSITNTDSEYLFVGDFDIDIAADSIDGIEIEIIHDLSIDGEVFAGSASLTKNGSTPLGTGKSIFPTIGEETDVYGNVADTWGVTLSEAEVEAATFGVIFLASVGSGGGFINWAINQVRLKVHYTESIPTDIVLPDADIVTTGWSTAPLFSKINDASDATVIQATAV